MFSTESIIDVVNEIEIAQKVDGIRTPYEKYLLEIIHRLARIVERNEYVSDDMSKKIEEIESKMRKLTTVVTGR